MGVDDKQRPVKMTLPEEIAFALDDIATKKKRESGNWKIGAGTIAAEIIGRVFASHPEILRDLFSPTIGTDAARIDPTLAESHAEYETKPKKVGRKR